MTKEANMDVKLDVLATIMHCLKNNINLCQTFFLKQQICSKPKQLLSHELCPQRFHFCLPVVQTQKKCKQLVDTLAIFSAIPSVTYWAI